MFYSMRPDGQFDDFSLHGACPVITGEGRDGFGVCLVGSGGQLAQLMAGASWLVLACA